MNQLYKSWREQTMFLNNRFQILMGKYHPGMCTFLSELQKEQADVEIMLMQLWLTKKLKKHPDPKRRQKDQQIFNIVANYQNYVTNNDVMNYLKNISYIYWFL